MVTVMLTELMIVVCRVWLGDSQDRVLVDALPSEKATTLSDVKMNSSIPPSESFGSWFLAIPNPVRKMLPIKKT